MSDEFPVSWTEDHRVTRRAFARSLASASACSFGATALLALAARGGAGPRAPEVRVAAVGELPIGGARVFEYVAAGGPCILLRLAADSFVAYAQRCTHLGCPVIYEAARRRLYCPCHEGFFDAGSGEVLAGPPPRRLPRIELERRGLELWAVGVRP
jgi:arsenite oxidase small subunit